MIEALDVGGLAHEGDCRVAVVGEKLSDGQAVAQLVTRVQLSRPHGRHTAVATAEPRRRHVSVILLAVATAVQSTCTTSVSYKHLISRESSLQQFERLTDMAL